LNPVHDVEFEADGLFSSKNASKAHSFEYWGNGDEITIAYSPHPRKLTPWENSFESHYPYTDIKEAKETFYDPRRPSITAASFRLNRNFYHPLRTYEHGDGFSEDPLTNILGGTLNSEGNQSLIQIIFRPLPDDWTKIIRKLALLPYPKFTVEDAAQMERQPTSKGWLNPEKVEATQEDELVARMLEKQRSKKAFQVSINVLSLGNYYLDEDRQATHKRSIRQLKDLVAEFKNGFHNQHNNQYLEPVYVTEGGHGPDILRPHVPEAGQTT